MTVVKPTVGATGWNTAVDQIIDIINSVAGDAVVGRVVRAGPGSFDASIPTGTSTSGYFVAEKADTTQDASILFRSGGHTRGEIGLPGDDDLHIKAVTGTTEAGATFTDAIIVKNATGYVWVPTQLGVGTIPVEAMHTAVANATGRIYNKIENTSANTGSNSGSAGVYMSGRTHDWALVTDVGLNGGNNFGVISVTLGGTPVVFADSSGNVAINSTGSFGSGTGVVFIANRTAAPSGTPTGGGVLYVESGALKYKGSSGTVTTVAAA